MVERLSLIDNSLFAGYSENIQRIEFALDHCRGKRVLDAGCGTGYSSHFLASHGAASVLAVDISTEAITEANQHYQKDNLRFERRDVQVLDQQALRGQFDVVVNLENLAHLPAPEKFIDGVKAVLAPGGTFVTSTPNGDTVGTDEHGRPVYQFQFKAYKPNDFRAFLTPHFSEVALYGHWLTHEGMLRKIRARELFEQLCEAYYNPMCKLGRVIKRIAGKKVAPPPSFSGAGDSFRGDYLIAPLHARVEGDVQAGAFSWPPTTLIAVCKV